jgi:hypothetical protein
MVIPNLLVSPDTADEIRRAWPLPGESPRMAKSGLASPRHPRRVLA